MLWINYSVWNESLQNRIDGAIFSSRDLLLRLVDFVISFLFSLSFAARSHIIYNYENQMESNHITYYVLWQMYHSMNISFTVNFSAKYLMYLATWLEAYGKTLFAFFFFLLFAVVHLLFFFTKIRKILFGNFVLPLFVYCFRNVFFALIVSHHSHCYQI